MPQQMSLFPPKDVSDQKTSLFEGDGSALDEVFSAVHRFRSSREYLQLLRFISRFPSYSAFSAFLLYLQNPDATYVATSGTWRKRFKRELKPGARPLLILAPMSPVRFVFDLKDTQGEAFPPPDQRYDPDAVHFTEEIFENTTHKRCLSAGESAFTATLIGSRPIIRARIRCCPCRGSMRFCRRQPTSRRWAVPAGRNPGKAAEPPSHF